ncbi:MAG TPA: hypothetical protein VKW76_12770 [Candidatus Binatia bacterium]|nr:hypothetical protein [Candidatus Binatia bacterium]
MPTAERFAIAFVPVLFAATVFGSITGNFFHTDDFFHLYTIANRGFLDFVLMPYGGHMLLARNALFYLCYLVFGTAPGGYFWVALLTHLLNVWLLFEVVAALTTSLGLACFAATLWGTLPAHAETLGWYSVYGEVVCATLLLIVLLGLARQLDGVEPVRTPLVLLWSVLIVVASTCFGEGMAIAALFPVVVPLFVSVRRISIPSRIILLSVPLVVAALYVWITVRFEARIPMPMFTIMLAFASFGRLIAEMWYHLLGYGVSALLLGFFGSPTAYPDAAARAALGGALAALVVCFIRGDGRSRRAVGALLLLAGASYASIAVGRAALYSSYTSNLAQPATAARYHYVALVPLAAALPLVLRAAVPVPLGRRLGPAPLALGLGTLLAGFLLFPPRIDHHDADRQATDRAVASMHTEIAKSSSKIAILVNSPFAPATLLEDAFPGIAGVYMIYHPTNVAEGRRIYFSVSPQQYLAALRAGGRLPTLLVPTAVPPPATHP